MTSFQNKKTKGMMMMMHRRRLHPPRLIKNTNPLFVIPSLNPVGHSAESVAQHSKKQNLVPKSSGKMNASYDQHITIAVASLASTGGRGGGCSVIRPNLK